jgi:hypothetical protein
VLDYLRVERDDAADEAPALPDQRVAAGDADVGPDVVQSAFERFGGCPVPTTGV